MNSKLVKELDEAPLGNDDANPNHYDFESWEDIFFIQAKKDGANYQMLCKWLMKYFDIPKLKTS